MSSEDRILLRRQAALVSRVEIDSGRLLHPKSHAASLPAVITLVGLCGLVEPIDMPIREQDISGIGVT